MRRNLKYGWMVVKILAAIWAGLLAVSVLLHFVEVRRFDKVRQRTANRVNKAANEMGIGTSIVVGRTPEGEPWYSSDLRVTGEETDDARLAPLEGLRDAGLEGLSLFEASITDDGLKSLRNLNDLLYLQLAETNISDEGIKHLLPLAKLRQLDLSGTQVTQEAGPLLQQLPDLQVVYTADTALHEVPGVTVRSTPPGMPFLWNAEEEDRDY